jgi:hypothetical protein
MPRTPKRSTTSASDGCETWTQMRVVRLRRQRAELVHRAEQATHARGPGAPSTARRRERMARKLVGKRAASKIATPVCASPSP